MPEDVLSGDGVDITPVTHRQLEKLRKSSPRCVLHKRDDSLTVWSEPDLDGGASLTLDEPAAIFLNEPTDPDDREPTSIYENEEVLEKWLENVEEDRVAEAKIPDTCVAAETVHKDQQEHSENEVWGLLVRRMKLFNGRVETALIYMQMMWQQQKAGRGVVDMGIQVQAKVEEKEELCPKHLWGCRRTCPGRQAG